MFASKNVRVCLAFGSPELRCSAETAESEQFCLLFNVNSNNPSLKKS